MSDLNELNDFDLALAKLKEQMRELEIAREKKKKEIELATPVKIHIYEYRHYDKSFIFTIKPERDDIYQALSESNLAFRTYNNVSEGGYIWHCKWDKMNRLKEVISSLPNVESSIKKYVQELLDEYNNVTDYWISVDNGHLIIKHNIRTYQGYALNGIPGSEYNVNNRSFSFPKKEAWRVYIILNQLVEFQKVVLSYADGALEFILKQVKEREELNLLACMERYEPYMSIDLNGYPPLPFQSVGIRFAELANGNGRGMIWDEMGLGKTYQGIALSKILSERDYPDDPTKFKTFIICPAHLTYNWYRELKKYRGPETSIIVFRGLTPSQGDTIRALEKKYDYAIVSYNLLGKRHKFNKEEEKGDKKEVAVNLWARLINIARPDLAIFDEAHYMGNIRSGRSFGGQEIESKYVLELTGTPLVNRPPELQPLLAIVDPQAFGSPTEFTKAYTLDGKRPRNTKELHELLRPIVIRRTKKDVMKDLPPIKRIPQYIELDGKALIVYNKALQGIAEYIDSLGNKWETQIPNILAKINRLRKICGIAKMERTSDLATEIYEGNEEDTHRKIICFSYWKETTYGIHLRLNPNSISFVDKSPSGIFNTIPVEKRYERCDEFTTDPSISYLAAPLMSTQEGLNITAAGSCIFNDMWWNPKAHEQAEGRAYGRISDPHSLNSYYILCEGTIDEAIWDLVWGTKAGIIAEVVDGVEMDREYSITRKLIERLMEDAKKLKGT